MTSQRPTHVTYGMRHGYWLMVGHPLIAALVVGALLLEGRKPEPEPVRLPPLPPAREEPAPTLGERLLGAALGLVFVVVGVVLAALAIGAVVAVVTAVQAVQHWYLTAGMSTTILVGLLVVLVPTALIGTAAAIWLRQDPPSIIHPLSRRES